MALCGIGFNSGLNGIGFKQYSRNSSSVILIKPTASTHLVRRKSNNPVRRRRSNINCSTKKDDQIVESVTVDEKLGPVMKFKMSDFTICDCTSVGLGGRADEIVFEAIVNNPQSPLYNSRVVLRRYTSSQAQRRGKRAIEVLKKLARRKFLYHSYSMQVHGYVASSGSTNESSFTLVHGYHGSYSLRHWLQLPDWLPTLEATLALDEESVRKVGDDKVGGSAISRKLRIIRILMRDLLVGVNYLHSHGLAHTELKLENVHISPLDRHIKVGILGNSSDFYEDNPGNSTLDANMDRRQMMIAFDMRCVGFMMAKIVLRELMDPIVFMTFKSFLTKGNQPSCLREFLLPILCKNSPSGNAGLQLLDRNWGAGWNLLSSLLATKPSERIHCLDALRHPFLCGPRWRVYPPMDMIRWGLGSTAVRITEEYIYGRHQRSRLAHFIELMEMLNPNQEPKNWLEFLPGKWRLLYSTGRHIGLTLRQPSTRVLIGDVYLSILQASATIDTITLTSNINFSVLVGPDWPHEKRGISGKLKVDSVVRVTAGKRKYLKEETGEAKNISYSSNTKDQVAQRPSKNWRRASPVKEPPSSLPVAKLASGEIEVTMNLDDSSLQKVNIAKNVIQEVRTLVPPEIFDVSKLVCGTFLDSRLLVLRGVNGSALLFTRSCR
ncbi:probable plastid-lipid-associated protein 14, chloroplastic [Papaver somniferum]|uniref:probable plastid-lipid-associated protein 14, chloroplastic n=1 Tax=Papaver somniferum TaxID=3469 RepID=UPI000E7026B1|nr:probable plastid-lipid-associated protein 14, chloroplastic [Papaver somniferum]